MQGGGREVSKKSAHSTLKKGWFYICRNRVLFMLLPAAAVAPIVAPISSHAQSRFRYLYIVMLNFYSMLRYHMLNFTLCKDTKAHLYLKLMYALPFKFEWLCYFILNACYFSIFWSILFAKKN
jgi:hypothetical protein